MVDRKEMERILCDQVGAWVKLLVHDPDLVRVEVVPGERTTVFNVICPQSCIGSVLGGKGRNISALRTLVMAVASKNQFRAIIEVPHYPVE